MIRLPSTGQLRAHVSRRAGGFTLIELMVTIAIVGILITLVAPSMVNMIAGNRVQSEASSLVGDLMQARAEAIKRGQPVTLCPSSDGLTCLAGNTWGSGWIVFVDTAPCSASPPTPVSTSVLRVRSALKGGDTFTAAPVLTCLGFNREGLALNLGGANAYFKLHATTTPGATRCVLVKMTGSVSTQTPKTDPSCT